MNKPRRRQENTTKTNLKQLECECVDWLQSQDRVRLQAQILVNTILNIRVSQEEGHFSYAGRLAASQAS
jgi:hypothetical protein